MIVGRIHFQGSKLALTQQWNLSSLWGLCGTAGPVGFGQAGMEPKERSWTLQSVLDTLKSVRANDMSVGEMQFKQISEPSQEALKVLELLRVKLPE